MKPAVWITRTAPGAMETARAVSDLGYEAITAPVLKVQTLKAIIDPHSFDAVIVTSRNGLEAFRTLCPRRAAPVWCVGDATAEAARIGKFQEVISAGGTVDDLIALICAHGDRHIRFLYAAAKTPAAPLTARLRNDGFTVTETTVYETQAVPSPLAVSAFDRLTHILVHSARGGRAIAETLIAHHDKIAFRNLTFICISEAAWQGVEAGLRASPETQIRDALDAGLKRFIAATPDDTAMLRLLQTDE